MFWKAAMEAMFLTHLHVPALLQISLPEINETQINIYVICRYKLNISRNLNIFHSLEANPIAIIMTILHKHTTNNNQTINYTAHWNGKQYFYLSDTYAYEAFSFNVGLLSVGFHSSNEIN